MGRFRHVLAAVDLSSESERILAQAAWLARASDALLTVLHVSPEVVSQGLFYLPEVAVPSAAGPVIAPSELRGRLGALATGLALPRPIDLVVREGDADREILRFAGENRVDLIVVGRHAHPALERLLFVHVGASVARNASCSVLAVPALNGAPAPPARPREVLCALDLGDTSSDTLELAAELAWTQKAHLTALHVIDAQHWEDPWPLARGDEQAVRRELTRDAHDRLTKLMERAAIPGQHADSLIFFGRVGPEIARVASLQGTSLLVMGAHRGRLLGQTFLGSTARHVLSSTACPVLLARPATTAERPAQEHSETASGSSSPSLRE
jgi:nucleotide-binding universal stress UspA family protein